MSEEDFRRLPLEQRLDHKLWKARLDAYQELGRNFEGGRGEVYWKKPEVFGKYLMDSNVVAQEQMVMSLETFLKEVEVPGRGVDMKSVFETWIGALAEKGLSSSRATTREKAGECILLLCSLDESIMRCVDIVLPFCEKKMPRLVANAVHTLRDLISSFGLVNCNVQQLLPQLLSPLVKLAGHADKGVRSETLGLIVDIYKCTGKNKAFLQELLLDQLKPIHQKELDKLFAQVDSGSTQDIGPTARLFAWQNQLKDQDGDTVMEGGQQQQHQQQHQQQPQQRQPQNQQGTPPNLPQQSSQGSIPMNPLDLLPEQTILDKLPENFYARVSSSKWKERVDSLQELHDGVLVPLKKLKVHSQDYTELFSTLGHVIGKDSNVQVVSSAAQCISEICRKIRSTHLNKNYVGLSFTPLLERTKERKTTVVETVRNALQSLCQQQYPLSPSGHNEDMLQDILNFMRHKTPQIRQETTLLFVFNLTKLASNNGSKKILQKYLPDEICPTVTKIVNDTQPTIRECGFECFAVLLKILGRKELHFALEKLDNLKTQKIQEHFDKLPEFESPQATPTSPSVPQQAAPPTAETSTIPSKRGPSSPLKKSNSPNVPKSRVLLTSRTLGTPPPQQQQNGSDGSSLQPAATTTTTTTASPQVNTELNKLQRDKSEWIQERHQLLSQVNKLSNSQTNLVNENESLRDQLKMLQTDLHERGLQLRSKDLQLTKLQDRIAQLELDLRESHIQQQRQISLSEPASAISTNLGVRSISSSSIDPASAATNTDRDRDTNRNTSNRPKHLRSPSESSDDLPRRVDSLQLSSNQSGITGSTVNPNITTTSTASSSSSDAINEESWKRAAEVTSQLKARIERMRAKTRGIK